MCGYHQRESDPREDKGMLTTPVSCYSRSNEGDREKASNHHSASAPRLLPEEMRQHELWECLSKQCTKLLRESDKMGLKR